MDWMSAVSYCGSISGSLASIHSNWENHYITNNICARNNFCWIGLTRYSGGTLAWIDGTKVDYTNWDKSQPNNDMYKGGRDKVSMHPEGVWYYDRWEGSRYAICKKQDPVPLPRRAQTKSWPTSQPNTLVSTKPSSPTPTMHLPTYPPSALPSVVPSYSPSSAPSLLPSAQPTTLSLKYPSESHTSSLTAGCNCALASSGDSDKSKPNVGLIVLCGCLLTTVFSLCFALRRPDDGAVSQESFSLAYMYESSLEEIAIERIGSPSKRSEMSTLSEDKIAIEGMIAQSVEGVSEFELNKMQMMAI